MHWRRTTAIGTTALIIVGLILYGFQPTPEPVDVAEVTRGPLSVTIEEEGRTRIIDRYTLSAPLSGYIRRIELDVGDSVSPGQPLLQLAPLPAPALDPRSRAAAEARVQAAEATLQAARAQQRAAEAEAELAQLEYQRIVNLCKVQCASKEAEDFARTKVRSTEALAQSARFNTDISRHQLAAAKTALAYTGTSTGEPVTITAPIKGRVLKLFRKSEGVVAAAEPLIEIGDPQQLEIEVDLLSADAVKIAPGTPVAIKRWGGDEVLEGRVRTIEPVGFTKISALGVEEQRVLVIADFTSPPERWQRLGHGYRIEASFVLWQADNTLTLPASSLFRSGKEGWAVFVVENGRAKKVDIQLGQRNGLQAQVLSGLTEGEQVITHPGEAIEEGVLVEVR